MELLSSGLLHISDYARGKGFVAVLCAPFALFCSGSVLKHHLITSQRAENKRVDCSFLNRLGGRVHLYQFSSLVRLRKHHGKARE